MVAEKTCECCCERFFLRRGAEEEFSAWNSCEKKGWGGEERGGEEGGRPTLLVPFGFAAFLRLP